MPFLIADIRTASGYLGPDWSQKGNNWVPLLKLTDRV
jgi:hypothetical protein